MPKLKVSSTQFDLKRLQSPDEFWTRVETLVKKAEAQGSNILQFPEYFSLSWLLAHNGQDFAKALNGFERVEKEFHQRFTELAKSTNQVIVAGSVPVIWRERRVNRSFIYLPDGRKFEQDKQNMTRFENEEWSVAQGQPVIRIFEWKGATIGVAICYDVEFPDYVKKLVAQDVDLILVPSCTDDIHGYWRVRHCAEARGVEGQVYVVMSSIVGGDPAHSEIDVHYGQAGWFTPCDKDFPPGGTLALGELNKEGVATHLLDFALLENVRKNGTVLNRRDNT